MVVDAETRGLLEVLLSWKETFFRPGDGGVERVAEAESGVEAPVAGISMALHRSLQPHTALELTHF